MCVFSQVPSLCDARCGHLIPPPSLGEVYKQFRDLPRILDLEVIDGTESYADKIGKLLNKYQELSEDIDKLAKDVKSAKVALF
mmetsp:Transcript_32136/g.55500  ORF Transcript_32136/g.55500 Transcript_32136/m.55500 type:complete len:83 (+) Transcript_32136:1299-1547(+)